MELQNKTSGSVNLLLLYVMQLCDPCQLLCKQYENLLSWPVVFCAVMQS